MRRTVRLVLLLAVAATLLMLPARASAEPAVALSGTSLTFFDTATPGTFVTRTVAGLPSTVTSPVVAMDIRPADGNLYVVTRTDGGGGTDDSVGQLWKIDVDTAVATQVGTPFSSTLNDVSFIGMDVNPVADRIRLIDNDRLNLRVNPDTGALAATDTLLSASDLFDLAYDRNVSGATATTAFAIDFSTDNLHRIGGVDGTPSANGGVVTTIGPLGTGVTNAATFDISPSTGIAYVAEGANLYTVNLTTGSMSPNATMTFGTADGIALLGTSTIQVDPATASVAEQAGSVAITITRTGVTNKPATVQYATADGTATAGSDYTATSGTLGFAAGETSRTIHVPVATDAVNDGGETFTFTLSNALGKATLGSALTTTVTITQETTKPVVLALALAPRTFAVLARNGITAPFSVSEAARTTATLKLGTRVVGRVPAVTTTGAAITRVRGTLTLRGRTIVRNALAASRTGRVVLLLTLRTQDTSGNAKSTVVRVVIRR